VIIIATPNIKKLSITHTYIYVCLIQTSSLTLGGVWTTLKYKLICHPS